jgi:hypothetical protein
VCFGECRQRPRDLRDGEFSATDLKSVETVLVRTRGMWVAMISA